ncbi:MAG: polyprenyl synthetase family protein [Anaerolineae bacterium]|nr:polyprenyl synthetase family protein [Anaerolineae bacterium]
MLLEVSACQIINLIFSLPEMGAWPEARRLFEVEGDQPRLDWQLPALACQAVGGSVDQALPAVGAIACAKLSCILVDDILDDDPRGLFRSIGSGRAANLALGLLAASFAIVDRSDIAPDRKAAVISSLATMSLGGAAGQELDAQNLQGEENYWKVVQAKGSPFYAASLETGALLGGADPALARKLYDLGTLFGEIVQIYDDLEDAFKVPAAPDWREDRTNLLILYALVADHPQREHFARLRSLVYRDEEVLQEAQRILVTCGAVSYGIYHLAHRYQACKRLLRGLELADPSPMWELLEVQVAPLREWLHTMSMEVPPELAE